MTVASACTGGTDNPQSASSRRDSDAIQAMVTFRVVLPAPVNQGEGVFLTVLDEVTGLALNGQNFSLTAESARSFYAILPFPLGSVIKYRYTRQSQALVQEHTSDGRPVRYRLYHVTGPGIVEDTISRWTDTAFSASAGRISGVLTDHQTGKPLPNILICAGGEQTWTSADGSYSLEGLPPGLHNLAAYAPDGTYQTVQQGAVVASGSKTEANLQLQAASFVTVGFLVSAPADTPGEAAIRLAGNLWQLGNTFSELPGGVNTLANRMPVMSRLPDGRYNLSISLPAGADIRYKYTLGDGLWSAEQGENGGFLVRHFIVPAADTLIEDRVAAWQSAGRGAITFQVYAPSTPDGESVSIQFNPGFSWMAPIPMWPVGEKHWKFILTSPLELLKEVGYRYCREDQCGRADDLRTPGADALPLGKLTIQVEPHEQNDQIELWKWQSPFQTAAVPNLTIQPRGDAFIAGIEFLPAYDPTWGIHLPRAVQTTQMLNANWLFLSPTWSYTRLSPPVLEPVAGRDILWPDLTSTLQTAASAGLRTALYPTPTAAADWAAWWHSAPRDYGWWVSWFDQYERFILNYADLAARSGAQALVLGGEWIEPALPNGLLDDGTSSGAPQALESRWLSLIAVLRGRYDGLLLWAMPASKLSAPPPFLSGFDGVYVLWDVPIAAGKTASESAIALEAGAKLDAIAAPFVTATQKPIILGLSFASADGSAAGCLSDPSGGCLTPEMFSRIKEDIPDIHLDFDEQTHAYNAMFLAIEQRPWINGVVARGFYPPLPLQDKSFSVYGKPAAGAVWFWYQLWRKIQP
jgi:hypothetical protein